jgi:hypothetical protein
VVAPSEATTEPGQPTRQEYFQALVEQSWARPTVPRPVAKPHLVLMVAVVVTAGALGLGAVLQFIHPIPLPKPPPPPPAPVPAFTAVSGWDCGYGGSNYGFEAQGRTSAWYTVPSGGWTQDGCHGTFESIPMTGNTNTGGPSQSAVWWFTPGSKITRCAVMVFLPAPQVRQDSAATVAQFSVLSGLNGTPLASFVLNEAADPGSWAAVGTFPVTQGGIAVDLVGSGAPPTAGARLAITQVKVTCTG